MTGFHPVEQRLDLIFLRDVERHRLGSGAIEYHVDVDYSNSTTLTPSQFHADVKIGGVWKSADFTNVAGGGSNGTAQATSMVSWLQGKGCY